jgi:predicted metal-dependent hydrolase
MPQSRSRLQYGASVTKRPGYDGLKEVNLRNVSPAGPAAAISAHREAFLRGIEQFNSGLFFEAHETWEEIWLHSLEPEKTFLQGIIQITAAFHHYSRNNPRGARSLLEAALRRLKGFPDNYSGIALLALRSAAETWIVALAGKHRPFPRDIPRIELVGTE